MIGRGNGHEAEVTGGKHRPDTVVPIRPEAMAAIMNDPEAAGPPARPVSSTYQGPGTRCPGCGGSQWLVGRALAECARCASALPLNHPSGEA